MSYVIFAGAIALVDAFSSTASRYFMASIECSGLESSIFNCTGELQTTQSCSPFGVASVVCHGKTIYNVSYCCTDITRQYFKMKQGRYFMSNKTNISYLKTSRMLLFFLHKIIQLKVVLSNRSV